MTTNQPTQPDMFEPPEKFGNYLADKSLAAFNQPTDATRFKTALYAQCPEPVADDIWQRFESLTAQLAAKQAEAKAWEAWGEKLHHEFFWALDFFNKFIEERGMFIDDEQEYMEAKAALSTPKPQPVDASSLARIARVALVAYKFMHAEKSTNCGIDFWSEFVDAYNAIQPNDIALAQALAGGA